jgi:hypothetical protein
MSYLDELYELERKHDLYLESELDESIRDKNIPHEVDEQGESDEC